MYSDKGTLVAENENWSLWENDSTRNYQKELDAHVRDGFTLAGIYRVVFAKSKTSKEEMYLAMDRSSGRPIIDWKDPYDFDIKKIILMDWYRDDCNIVSMAKKRRGIDED